MKTTGARQRGRAVIAGCAILLVAALFAGGATGAPARSQATSLTVGVLPIANTLPLDLGIKKGFFDQQGIEIKKITAQSGNDIMLGLANSGSSFVAIWSRGEGSSTRTTSFTTVGAWVRTTIRSER